MAGVVRHKDNWLYVFQFILFTEPEGVAKKQEGPKGIHSKPVRENAKGVFFRIF